MSGDAAALHAFDGLPEVARFQSYGPKNLEACQTYIAEVIEAAQGVPRLVHDLAICVEDTIVGRVGLGRQADEPRVAALWYVVHPDHQGQGFASEAAHAMVGFAFGGLDVHRVFADCDPRNLGSCRVAEKLNMRLEGQLIENVYLKDRWCDSMIYAVLRREWNARS